jgi:hypothetical protein
MLYLSIQQESEKEICQGAGILARADDFPVNESTFSIPSLVQISSSFVNAMTAGACICHSADAI